MRIAFFISSVGDTDLALKTITLLEKHNQYESLVISLTKSAQQRAENFKSPSISQTTLNKILNLDSDAYPDGVLKEQQLISMNQFLHEQKIDSVYLGVPSVSNEIPFQLAQRLTIPSIIAYEFMFKPEKHSLWSYLPSLSSQSNTYWAIPLASAKEDFPIPPKRLHVTGHLSIDNAFAANAEASNSSSEIRKSLLVEKGQSLVFASSTTQPVKIDSEFLDCLLTELQNHPNMQVRLGLHPGIQDFDDYLQEILKVSKKYPEVVNQFKIILPENIINKVKKPELTINNPTYEKIFLRANVTGSEAALAADRITQAVPGALLNQAVLEGKPTYSHAGKPYLPKEFFSNSIASFFTSEPKPKRTKGDLGLEEKSAPEVYASLFQNLNHQ